MASAASGVLGPLSTVYQVPNASADYFPALAYYNNNLVIAYTGTDKTIYWSTFSYNGTSGSWSNPVQVVCTDSNSGNQFTPTTTAAPALVVYEGKLCLFFQAASQYNPILWATYNGTTWASTPVPNAYTTGVGFSAAVGQGLDTILFVWPGMSPQDYLFYSTYNTSSGWAPIIAMPNFPTTEAPSLAASGSSIYLAFLSSSSGKISLSSYSWSANAFSAPIPTVNTFISGGPAVAAPPGGLLLAWLNSGILSASVAESQSGPWSLPVILLQNAGTGAFNSPAVNINLSQNSQSLIAFAWLGDGSSNNTVYAGLTPSWL